MEIGMCLLSGMRSGFSSGWWVPTMSQGQADLRLAPSGGEPCSGIGSSEEVVEEPDGTFGSNLGQEEPRPPPLLGASWGGFWGSHREQELCSVQEGGFALLSFTFGGRSSALQAQLL